MKVLDVPSSGSLAGITASRNRFGQYKRTRAIPVNPNSAAQGTVRARMSANAASWRGLTNIQRVGWSDLGAQMSRSDSLGQAYTLTGFQAYCSVNNVLANMGSSLVGDAPALQTPSALLTGTLTASATVMSLAYTATPLPTGAKLFTSASPQRSAGRSFEGDFRQISVSAAAAASPANLFASYQAKFGTPVVGNRIFVSATVALAGFESGPFITSVIVA